MHWRRHGRWPIGRTWTPRRAPGAPWRSPRRSASTPTTASPSKPYDCESPMTAFSPREIVSELDRFIIGQGDAKRAVAIALRNRWRRRQLPEALRQENLPTNILMIGPPEIGRAGGGKEGVSKGRFRGAADQ